MPTRLRFLQLPIFPSRVLDYYNNFVPNNRYLRKVLILFFHSKKTAAKANRELQNVYGDAALSKTTCRDWFRRIKRR